MNNTKFENKLKLWKILHNKIPYCQECKYWTHNRTPWCIKHKRYPQKDKEIKRIKIENNTLKVYNYLVSNSFAICGDFK